MTVEIRVRVKVGVKIAVADAPKNLLICTSRLIQLKGLNFLIEAVDLIRDEDFMVWVVGAGPQRNELIELVKAKQLESKIIFKGQAGYLETQRMVGSAAVFVQPNVAPEAFGIGMAEAMGLGIPVIASDVPALNELMENEKHGLLVPAANPEALAKAITRVFKDKDLRKTLSSNAREKVREHYTAKRHLTQMEKCIQQAVAEFKSSDAKSST